MLYVVSFVVGSIKLSSSEVFVSQDGILCFVCVILGSSAWSMAKYSSCVRHCWRGTEFRVGRHRNPGSAPRVSISAISLANIIGSMLSRIIQLTTQL